MLRPFPALLGPALLIALLSSSGTQAASSSASSHAGGRPPGPPPEAIAACKGKSEGAEVSFAGPEGQTFSGTCQSFNGTLAAMPKGGPGGQPPPAR
ncbi:MULTISPECIES: hypothetical protein [unclassified Uliginosibacterium]|uniref:hypothetical protein n=1 Tax=unclassified Uliginosibacterium TaxID=2621521 RepID=UPI000C7D45B7|nr:MULTISPECIES: hypothetical protein [unclassified Uliginosibacterium]MDO6386124.1 hypothetical protein [Uliginosibacterium sp. 31-12]PLK49190.1 hypothetical protein C0V76_08295 [Uliginosibacterium sp. TH139]